jgi:hypothetical protein
MVVVSLPSIVGVRLARSHCSAGHDLSPVVSRDDKRSKNACLGVSLCTMCYRSLFTETRSPNGGWLPS